MQNEENEIILYEVHYDPNGGEFVSQATQGQTIFVTAFHNGADLPLPYVPGVLCILSRVAIVETCRVVAVTYMLHFIPPNRVNFPSGADIVNGMTVCAGDDGSIVSGFCPAFDLNAINACIHQILQMVNGTHIPGI